MNKSNSKGKVLNRKDFNTNGSVTPTKKTNLNVSNSSHNKTLNQTQVSYAASSGGVSYAQLQIILQNVKSIKAKASEHIKIVETKNGKMEKEIKQLREKIGRYEHLEETIKEEKDNIEDKYRIEIQNLNNKIEVERLKNEELSRQCEDKEQQLQQLDSKLKSLQKDLSRTESLLNQQIKKYQGLTATLAINENSHELKLIEEKYQNVPNLLTTLHTLQSDLRHYQKENDDLKELIEELKNQANGSQRIIQTVTSQNKSLLQKLEKEQEKGKDLMKTIEQLKSIHESMEKEQITQNYRLKEQIQQLEHQKLGQLKNKDGEIEKMMAKLKYFESIQRQVQMREQSSRQQILFKSVVDEVCDQYEDYKNVIKRVQYLEKYRSQYYFNIQKIQYLCKMLDS